MKILFRITFLLLSCIALAQPKPEMTPSGFAPIEFTTPNRPMEKLIEVAKSWAPYYNKKGFDVYDVTENSLKIDGFRTNAYFYRSLGETYSYNIKYTLAVVFNANKTYTVTFALKESYAKEALVKTTVADFFTPDGKLKDDFIEVKPSLERTVETIIKSFTNFIQN